MKKIPKEKSAGISLCYASANDGDWAEVLPETVKALQEHLGTQKFAVLTGEEQPERWLSEVVDSFRTGSCPSDFFPCCTWENPATEHWTARKDVSGSPP